MDIYDWKNAPDWAMWATRDSNGFAHWHELEPRRTDNPEYGDYGVEWGSHGQKSWECDPFWNQEVDCPPAEESKEQRPDDIAHRAISFFAQEKHRIAREKRIELIKEVIAAILAIIVFVALLVLILCLKWQGFDWLRVRWV